MPFLYKPYEFYYNGFTFGNGTPYAIIDIDGLASQPDLRVQDTPRGYNDGFLTGRDFFNGRTITFTIHIFGDSNGSAQTNWLTLQRALKPVQQLTPTNSLLYFNLELDRGGLPYYYMNARVRTRKAKIDPEYTYGMIKAQIEMFAPDYRYYDTQSRGSTWSPKLANGRIYNRTYNLNYSQAIYSGANAYIINNSDGTAATGPVFTITGPIKNPQLTNMTTGAYIQLACSLSAADTLVVDMTNNTVTLNGGNARNLMTGGSQFWTVPGGSQELVFFTAASSTGQVEMIYHAAFA